MQEDNNIVSKSYNAIGLMSGTSADGLDIAMCKIEAPDWSFSIVKTKTISYSGTSWPERFTGAKTASGYTLMELHRDFGRFCGKEINKFLDEYRKENPGSKTTDEKSRIDCDIIASHGHTIFHQPDRGITLQIGDGAEIAAVTGLTAISDFRRLDVALGGQGAPLVPIGDEYLFGRYDYCLNIGGFANISFRKNGKRLACDICPANIVLNPLAGSLGMEYDKGGELARSGKIDHSLLDSLESIDFYRLKGPRSLGKEWTDKIFSPIISRSEASEKDKLRTVSEHIASQIAGVIHKNQTGVKAKYTSTANNTSGTEMLITGGGARNKFLVGLISEKVAPVRVIVPDKQLVDFKEAVVFALLGVLRIRNEINCLASVTGAGRDNSGGIIYPARHLLK